MRDSKRFTRFPRSVSSSRWKEREREKVTEKTNAHISRVLASNYGRREDDDVIYQRDRAPRKKEGKVPETRAKEAVSPLSTLIVAVINRILLKKEKQLPEIRLG